MSTTLNNFIKYNFTIRTLIQILYEFRIRKTFNLLRIENLDSIILKTKTVMKTRVIIIAVYSVIIKNAIVENDSTTFFVKEISSLKVVIFVKSSTFAEKTIFFIKKLTFHQANTFIKVTIAFRVAVINEYSPFHIDVKNVIVFAFLKIKKIYNARH